MGNTVAWEVGGVYVIRFDGGTVVRLSAAQARKLAEQLVAVVEGK